MKSRLQVGKQNGRRRRIIQNRIGLNTFQFIDILTKTKTGEIVI